MRQPSTHAGDVLAAYYNPDNLSDRRLEVVRRVETHPYGIPIYVMEVYHGAVGDTPRFFTGFNLSFGTVQVPAVIGSELWHTPIMVQKVGVISDPYNVLFPIDGAAIISNDNQRLYNHRLFHIHYSQWDDGYFYQSAAPDRLDYCCP